MKEIWYVSERVGVHHGYLHGRLTLGGFPSGRWRRWTPGLAAALLACARLRRRVRRGGAGRPASRVRRLRSRNAGARDAHLAGARCKGGPGAPCACRQKNGDVAETRPPDADHKRFEIRLSAAGGGAHTRLGDAGPLRRRVRRDLLLHRRAAGDDAAGDLHRARRDEGGGRGARARISPSTGRRGPGGTTSCRCAATRAGRRAATATPPTPGAPRPRRASAVGSSRAARRVISHLRWDTSGGTGDRELGMFRDFKVDFTMEVKRFATEFHPGATECVPK